VTDSHVYSRVYHRLMNEYPTLWRSDAQLALFVRLLVLADKFWPDRPPLPRVNGAALRALQENGLLIVDEADCYRIRGLDAERNRRSTAARTAARSRYALRDAVPDALPKREEKRREEKGANALHDGRHPNCAVCEAGRAA
jgi:hypothetical protein